MQHDDLALREAVRDLGQLVALAVFSTGFAFVVYFRLLSTVGSIATSSQAYLRILIGVGLGIVFLGEKLSASVMIASRTMMSAGSSGAFLRRIRPRRSASGGSSGRDAPATPTSTSCRRASRSWKASSPPATATTST